MLEYVKILWEIFGWVGFSTAGGFLFYNLLLIYSLYRLEKQVKVLMKDKAERDEEDDEEDEEINNYFTKGGKSPQVITEISEG